MPASSSLNLKYLLYSVRIFQITVLQKIFVSSDGTEKEAGGPRSHGKS